MEIVLGRKSGFCYGVQNAVDRAKSEVINSKQSIYCLGELVHNKTVTDELALLILAVVVTIPVGKVASYGQVAALAGLPKHARLVGRVLSRMDDSSEVPWHRVINAQGRISLSRLDDLGFNEQQARLLSEGVVIKNGKINFKDFGWNI